MLITHQSGFQHINYDNVCKFVFQVENKDKWNLEASMSNGDVEVIVKEKQFDYVEKVFRSILVAKKAGRTRFDIKEVK